MSTRRILILTNRVPYPLNDGGNMAMNAMIKGYAKLGCDVFLLSMNTTRHYVDHETVNNIYKSIYGFETVDVDNNVTPLQVAKNFLFSKLPNHAERFYHPAYKKKLLKVLAEFKPDVVQMESVYLATYLPYIKQISNAKNILRLHNVEYEIWGRLANETFSSIKKVYLKNLADRIKKYEYDVWPKFDLLLPITAVDAKAVGEQSVNTIQVAPYGINKLENEPTLEHWVGYHIGAMDWEPNREGVQWFINDVFPEIKKAVPDFSFHFAGRNMPEEMNKLSIDGITCAGTVPNADAFIGDKKILIVPIHSGGGIRVKILEAMAAGKVVISTTVGMQGIDMDDRMHYLEANSAKEFSDALQWCFNNKKAAEGMAERAKQRVWDVYDQDKIMQDIQKAIEDIC